MITSSRLVLIVTMSLFVGFVAGSTRVGQLAAQTPPNGTQTPALRPAYLVVSARPIQPDKMGPYQQAAVPLARDAGVQALAAGDPSLHVLEGKWPYAGRLSIERYPSMDALLAFWNSPGYQAAKKLREGFVEMNFIVAIEGR